MGKLLRKLLWILVALLLSPCLVQAGELAWLPPVVSPGDTVYFSPVDEKKTPPEGVWRIAGVNASRQGGALTVQLPQALKPGEPLEVIYFLPGGHESLQASTEEDVRVLPRPPVSPRPTFGPCGPQLTRQAVSCFCGWFPERSGLVVDGQPASELLAASSRSVCLRLPPGSHQISGSSSAGFDPDVKIEVGRISIRESPRQKAIVVGQPFTMTWRVVGTSRKVALRLRNLTPGIGKLLGGDDQVVTTTGGISNSASLTATISTPDALFSVQAELQSPDSPFQGRAYLDLLEEVFHRELDRLTDWYMSAVREIPTIERRFGRDLYPAEPVARLLDTTQRDLHASLPYPELAAFREYVDGLLAEAREALGTGPLGVRPVAFRDDRPPNSVEKERALDWLRRIGEALNLGRRQKLARDLFVVTLPLPGARFEMHPKSYPSYKPSTSTNYSLCNVPIGRYVYTVSHDDFQTVTGFTLDLVREEQQGIECRLKGKGSNVVPCSFTRKKVEDCE
jgi:hypothetical protein